MTCAAWASAGQSPAHSALSKNPKTHLIPLTYECSFSSMGHPVFPVLSHFRTGTFWHHVFCKLMPHCVKNTDTHTKIHDYQLLSFRVYPESLPRHTAQVCHHHQPLHDCSGTCSQCCEDPGQVMHTAGRALPGPWGCCSPYQPLRLPAISLCIPSAVGQLFPQARDWG